MKEFISINTTPTEEECIQVGSVNYMTLARKECLIFIDQIKRIIQNIPEGVMFKIAECPHDFGTYLDIQVWFNLSIPEECEFVSNLEDNLPEHWDEESLKQLHKI